MRARRHFVFLVQTLKPERGITKRNIMKTLKSLSHGILIILICVTSFSVNGQVKAYIGTYNYQGVPDYLETTSDLVSNEFLARIAGAVPEGYPVPTYHPSYLTNNFQANMDIEGTTDITITYVAEGAGYRNVLGYYKYPTGNPPTTSLDVDTIYIVFPNVSNAGSGGGLIPGNKVNIGSFSDGTTLGFVIIANAWDGSTQTVGNGLWTLYSDKNINPNTNPDVRQQTIVLYDEMTERYVIGFEDIMRPSGDRDFNDALFYVTASDPSSVSNDDIPSLPCVWEGTVDSDWNNVANWNPPHAS